MLNCLASLACRDMILAKELMRTCYEGYQAMAAKLAPEIWRFKTSVGCIAHIAVFVFPSSCRCRLLHLGGDRKEKLNERWTVH